MTTKNGVLRGSFSLDSKYINADEFMSKTEISTTTNVLNPDVKPATTEETGVIIIPSDLDLKFQANLSTN